jgi:hypothetical protein
MLWVAIRGCGHVATIMLQNIKSNKKGEKRGKKGGFRWGILLMSLFRGKSFFANMIATFLTIVREPSPLRRENYAAPSHRTCSIHTLHLTEPFLKIAKILAAKELSQIFMKTCPLFF